MPQTRRVTFPVTGMTCAACQSTVERALTRTAGVSAASVNLMLHAATVAYDPARVDVPGLLDAVRDVGYDAAPPQTDDLLGAPAARAAAADNDGGRLWLKAAVSLVAGLAAMVLGMPLMAPDGHADHLASADPFMRWAATTLGPMLRAAVPAIYRLPPTVVSWVLLATTAVVMAWAGRDFYVRAWRNLRHGAADMNTLVAVGTGAAFLYSAAATVAPRRRSYAPASLPISTSKRRSSSSPWSSSAARSRPAPSTRPRARWPGSWPSNRQPRGSAIATAAKSIGRSEGCGLVTSWWSGPASACRSTASFSRGAPRWTRRCSLESRYRWPRRPMRGSSAAP